MLHSFSRLAALGRLCTSTSTSTSTSTPLFSRIRHQANISRSSRFAAQVSSRLLQETTRPPSISLLCCSRCRAADGNHDGTESEVHQNMSMEGVEVISEVQWKEAVYLMGTGPAMGGESDITRVEMGPAGRRRRLNNFSKSSHVGNR